MPANNTARWNTATHMRSALGSGLTNGVDRPVQALAISGSTLYVGGRFFNAGGAPARGLAQWDIGAQTWSTVGSGVDNGVHGYVYALAVSGNDLYAGGAFDHAGAITTTNVARWNTSSSSWFGLGNGTDNSVSTLHASNAIRAIREAL